MIHTSPSDKALDEMFEPKITDAPDIIENVIKDVAELPDRSRPDDWPDAMLVTGAELKLILERHLGVCE